jgi:hypothetical protein
VKTTFIGQGLLNTEDKEIVTAELKALPLQVFGDYFQKLFKEFNAYIQVGGDYFE